MKTEPIASAKLGRVQGLVHGFSTRLCGASTAYRSGLSDDHGDLNLGYTEHDTAGNVRTNRRRWLQVLGVDESVSRFALLRQEHGTHIHVVRQREDAVSDFTQPGTLPGDGLLTDLPGVLLTVQTADCVPVLLCDPVHHAVGAFHAGWRGTLARIVELGVRTMQELYGTEATDLLAAIGPSIGPESYVVGADLHRQFHAEFDDAASLFRKTDLPGPEEQAYLNLWEANRRQLLQAGVAAGNIEVLGLDTAADTKRFFSYRAEGGRTGRMMSSIGFRPEPRRL